jgi:hypothetical protein
MGFVAIPTVARKLRSSDYEALSIMPGSSVLLNQVDDQPVWRSNPRPSGWILGSLFGNQLVDRGHVPAEDLLVSGGPKLAFIAHSQSAHDWLKLSKESDDLYMNLRPGKLRLYPAREPGTRAEINCDRLAIGVR